jgi:hypothetical protein
MNAPSNFNPAEILAVCDAILWDGELNATELYGLAEWLNNHREACFHWPGNLLVKPLQEIWEDGHVSPEELQRVGQILCNIQAEWVRRQIPPKIYYLKQPPLIDLSAAQLPQIDYGCSIESSSDSGLFYDIELSGPTCSCPDWRTRRAQHPIRHLSRCCKHVLAAYCQASPDDGWPLWLGAFIENAVPPHVDQQWFLGEVKGKPVLMSSAPKDWSNVFAPKGSGYDRFGYNVVERRWAYSSAPYNSKIIAGMIHAKLGG